MKFFIWINMNFSMENSIKSHEVSFLYFHSTRHSCSVVLDRTVQTIKANLYEQGYTYEQFLLLDEQMIKGSRQLLICLGWLMDHVKLIETCMRYYLDSIAKSDQVCFDRD